MEKSSITGRCDWEHAHRQIAHLLRVSFCTAPGALDPISDSEFWEKKAEAVMKSNSCKNRKDIAGQSIDIEWHVCLGDTSVQILQQLKAFMLETGHEKDSFSDWNIFASMVDDIAN